MTKTAQLYGGGLYDLALEEGLTGVILEQLNAVRDLFKMNPDYVKLLQEPSVPFTGRCELIDEAFGSSVEKYLVNFIKLLCERGLVGEFGMCCDEFTRRYDRDNGIAVAYVTSAVALSQEQEQALRTKLEKQSGKTVRLQIKIDPRVVAGLRVAMEGVEMDGTAAAHLGTISRKLKETVV